MVFSTLVIANIGLTLVNRSFTASVLSTFRNRNNLLRIVLLLTIALLAAVLYIPLFRDFFRLASPTALQLGTAAVIGLASVAWFEVYKWAKRRKGVVG